jgi:hypothetical protein
VASTTEAEYIAASEASREGFLIKNFIEELGVARSSLDPVELCYDKGGTMAQAEEPMSHHKFKNNGRS